MGGAIPTSQRLAGGPASALPVVLRSLLMVDCGSAYTKVALAGLVEDRYRLLACAQAATTTAPPVADLTVGILDAIVQIERTIGRPLLRAGTLITPEQEDGTGVDGLALAMSAGGPLRLLTMGPGREAVAGLLYRAIGGLFVEFEALPASPRGLPEGEWQRLSAQVRALHPHSLLVIGAPFGAAHAQDEIEAVGEQVMHWIEALRGAAGETMPSTLPILFAGNANDAARLSAVARQRGAAVQAVETLSPSTLGPLSRAVGSLYEAAVLRQTPGYLKARAQASAPPMATNTALGGVIRYLAQHYQMNVVGADVGASSTALAAATSQGAFLPADHPNAGVGSGAGYVLRANGAPSILRWLPWDATESEVREYVLTRMLRPHVLPATARELALEHALAREAIRLAIHAPGSRLAGLHPVDVLLGTGGVLAHAPHPALAALILLDALQPRGITSLVIDTAGLATMLGTIPGFAPQAAAELTETDAVPLLLGSVISTAGDVPPGQPAVRVVLEYADGRQQVEDVAQGTLLRLPLALGERALLSLYPAAPVDIGLGPGQHARASEPIEGGVLGLVVDARGRPLALHDSPHERVARLREWQRALGVEA
ncbi:MAG: glutamate mutase L [Ktedonobacterales bacterium]|nr:glutamate mutase L [Ktedonobacterales bacterium]